MPTWTPDQLKAYEARSQAPRPIPQPPVWDAPLAAPAREDSNPARRTIRIVSYRRRLLDPDNLVVKWFVDSLRYAGFITDDTSKHIDLQVSQEQVKTEGEERTEIEVI